jgi:DNA-binding NarL/FixJ family response regulator
MEFDTELIHSGSLTPRETEVMLLVCSALADKDIAERLAISLNTVARHLEMIYIKMGLHQGRLNRRTALLRTALATGMVQVSRTMLLARHGRVRGSSRVIR